MRITALIDTYNYGRFIGEAVESALSQKISGHELEVIVVDDGSTDDTPERVRAFGDRVRYIRKENGGQGSAFNAGFAAASGDIICLLDADDRWEQGKLEKVAAAFAADPEAGLVRHYMADMDEEGRPLPPPGRVSLPDDSDRSGLLSSRLFTIGTSALSFRASALKSLPPVPPEIRICPDEYLFTLFALRSRIRTLPEFLARRRLHASNAGLYGHNVLNQANLEAFVKTREALDRALAAALEACGMASEPAWFEPSLANTARARVLLRALRGDKPGAFAEAFRWFASARLTARSLFKLGTMLLAAASPALYAAAFAAYDGRARR